MDSIQKSLLAFNQDFRAGARVRQWLATSPSENRVSRWRDYLALLVGANHRCIGCPLSAEATRAMYNAVCCSKLFVLCLRPQNLERPGERSAPLRLFGVPAGLR
jgi:hypothetical protein